MDRCTITQANIHSALMPIASISVYTIARTIYKLRKSITKATVVVFSLWNYLLISKYWPNLSVWLCSQRENLLHDLLLILLFSSFSLPSVQAVKIGCNPEALRYTTKRVDAIVAAMKRETPIGDVS